jgi:hypothetical protein
MSTLQYPHPDRIINATYNYSPQVAIDWEKYRVVVVESDDWGVGEPGYGLERVEELEDLYSMLEGRKGCDSQPAVFTGFACMSNPDYDAIRRNGFKEFIDKGPDKNSPVCKKWREGIKRGLFFPEYHSNLHHTSPLIWMDLLRGQGTESEKARELFEKRQFSQGRHIPEFQGMNIKDMARWVKTGIERFYEAVGYPATVAVTSDAYPETEVIWSAYGIQSVAIKNCKNNNGEVVVYHTKPWNNQNPWVPMGGYNRFYDLTYLARNVFFECSGDKNLTAESVVPVIERCWEAKEPAIISSHRTHYTGGNRVVGLEKTGRLLELLGEKKGARFLTSSEVVSLYRRGWSVRLHKKGYILRNWTEMTQSIEVATAVKKAISLPDGRECSGRIDSSGFAVRLDAGDYLVEF